MAAVDGGEVKVVIKDGPIDEVDFSKIGLEEAFKLLNGDHKGLTTEQVDARLIEYGYNKLPESNRNEILIFLGYMWNPLAWAMEAAAIISIALLDYADFALIVALLLVNSGISYVEESNADKAIKALAAALAPRAKALRNGKVENIESINLVPGDVIIIRLGDIVPADVKILEEDGGMVGEETPMQIDQAALTGESLPTKKFTGDVAFSGSAIKQGERHAIVYATGVNTFFGRAASLIASTNNVANLQIIMNKIGGMCLGTIGVWITIELIVQFAKYGHICGSGEGGCPTLTNMLVIIVGGIPIAMPTVLSVTLALGAFKLAKEGAIVARMSAVEEMAGMDILCSDKTGTLTLNKLSVETFSVYNPSGNHSVTEVLKFAALSANTVTEEPIDVVLEGCYPELLALKEQYKLIRYIPFNPTDKFTQATLKDEKTGEVFRLLKGSPQVVLKRAHNAAEIGDAVNNKIVEFANRGFRSLGVARAAGDGTNGETVWDMVGLIPMFDPPRVDTKVTIERCQEQGISVKMITGDHLLIGIETAKMLGMGMNMFTAEQLHQAKAGNVAALGKYKNVVDMVERANGFAEVFPEHKFEIVQILQDADHIVGMTGDGVNDAPALKKADVGIAVAGATDAARGAADIVLTEPGLSAISTAVVGARKIFQRMTTYSKYTVAMTFRICFTFGLLTVIYDWYFPTILIVIMAVFNDGAMIALSKDRVVASRLPNSWNLKNIFIMGIVYGLYLTLSSWVLYQVAVKGTFFEDQCQLPSLNDRTDNVGAWCANLITNPVTRNPLYPSITSDICSVPEYKGQLASCATGQQSGVSVLQQCIVEQKYVRGAMMRALLYVQVSVSGQALVFVVRNQGYSLFQRAGSLTYAAFFLAQTGSTVIGLFGFSGYNFPSGGLHDCVFCSQSTGQPTHFFAGGIVPQTAGEGIYTASVIGSVGYVIVAWVWAAIWYMGLDPIKWALCWILNEDGFRDLAAHEATQKRDAELMRASKEHAGTTGPEITGAAPASHLNPLGRASLTKPVNQYITGASASVVPVMRTSDGLTRVSNDPIKMAEIARRSKMLPTSAIDRQSKDAEKVFNRHSGAGTSTAATIKE